LIAWNLSGSSYGLDINAPAAGTYQFGTGQANQGATGQLHDDTAQRRWSLGLTAVGDAGSVQVDAKSGSVDADFLASPGTTGTVHVKGSWKCGS
jgi:hypothetical protein